MWPFLFTPLGKLAGTVLIVLGAWFAFARHYENKGAEKVIARIEKKVDANAKVADKVRNSVRSVPAERLRDNWTRD